MTPLISPEIEAYASDHSTPVPDLLQELREYTLAHVAMPQMQVGPLEGTFLKVLALACRAQRIVEVGTFTGYSTLMMAAALPEDGAIFTCELDDTHADIAQSFFDRSPDGHKITIARGYATESLARLQGPFDMAFIDADKVNYTRYFDLIESRMRPGGLIVVDNVLWSGKVLQPPAEQEESTRAINALNAHLRAKSDMNKVMLTVRDGMTLAVIGGK